MPGDGDEAARRHAPATTRNRDAIAAVLADWLPPAGKALEVASGSGEHAVHFAAVFPVCTGNRATPTRPGWFRSPPGAPTRAS